VVDENMKEASTFLFENWEKMKEEIISLTSKIKFSVITKKNSENSSNNKDLAYDYTNCIEVSLLRTNDNSSALYIGSKEIVFEKNKIDINFFHDISNLVNFHFDIYCQTKEYNSEFFGIKKKEFAIIAKLKDLNLYN
jgi:hypothetical protein